MTKRGPFIVFLLTCVTLGIYGIVWCVKTQGEMKAKGADIPHWILGFIPFVNFYWLWKWGGGVEKVTKQGTSAALAFILMIFGPIGMAVIQSKFNALA